MPRITAALALALVLPLPAQDRLALPARALTLEVVLGDVARVAGVPGLGNMLAVPELADTLLAVMAKNPVFDTETLTGVEPANLAPMLLAHLDRRQFGRMQASMDPNIVVFDARAGDAAASVYDAVVADCRSRGLPAREDSPLPDSRRVVTKGTKEEHWVLQRGEQVAFGIGAMMLELRTEPPRPPGFFLRGPVGPVLPRSGALFLADFAVACGTDKDADLELDVATDAQGYRQALVLRGKRAAGAPAPRPLDAAPKMPRLDGQFAIARGHVDPGACLAWALAVAQRLGIAADDEATMTVAARCSGPFAVGIAAPSLGGIYPRFALALRLQPGEDLMARLQVVAAGDDRFAVRTVDGVPTATIAIPGAQIPSSILQPSFCVLDDVLWLAESAKTLRAVRKAIGTGDDVFADVEATPCEGPRGATVLAEAWFDCAAIHARSAKVWGTLPFILSLVPDLNSDSWRGEPIVTSSQLPDASEVALTLGRGRAVLYASGDECGVRVAAPAIGPLLSLVGGVVLPMVPVPLSMGIEKTRKQAAAQATQARATRLGEALRAYRSAHKDAMPAKLEELVALLPPGDPHPLTAPHGPASDDIDRLSQFSFQRAPAGMTARPLLADVPGRTRTNAARRRPGAERPVFAFCGFGYQGHHLLILADGEVTWVPSDVLLEQVLPGGKR